MIAAVAAMTVFAFLALEATNDGRVALISASSGATRARLSAEADAGFALAVHGLGIVDPARRWNAAGDLRTVAFNGDELTIGVENEGGKIPINFLLQPEIKRMFMAAGASSDADALTREFLERRDGFGPGSSHRSKSPLTSIDELALLKTMTPALFARLAPEVTVVATNLDFDPTVARPLALAVMAPNYRSARGAGPQPGTLSNLQGRAFTIRVDVSDGAGARLRRAEVVEITGYRGVPAIVRDID